MQIGSSKHFSKLYQDFVARFDSSAINNYFPCAPTEVGSAFEKIIQSKLEEYNARNCRSVIVESIRNYHSHCSFLTTAASKNLDLLSEGNAVAVVTGQQVGILGGPLYTFYKVIHSIQLAKEYNALFPQYRFVPIFWQETEDHDFEEVRSIAIIGADSEIKHISYSPSVIEQKIQVGGLKLEEASLNTFFAELKSDLVNTEFSEAVFALYRKCYDSTRTFAEAQSALLLELFADEGLLIINANSKELKGFASPIFEQEIHTAPQLSKAITSLSESFPSGYIRQIDAKGVNLFLSTNGKRLKIQKAESIFSSGEESYTEDELIAISSKEPQRLSMNVVMRPLVQDTLLPTVTYVAGPGETAYFAQLSEAYRWAKIIMPKIVPRFSATFLEDRFEKLFEKFQTSAEALIEFDGELVKQLLSSETESKISAAFEDKAEAVEAILESLRTIVEQADPSLAGALSSLKGKTATQLKDFGSKALSAERKKQALSKQKFDKVLSLLLPNGKLQERELNLIYFLNKYGLDFWGNFKRYILDTPLSFSEHHLLSVHQFISSEIAAEATISSN